MKIAVGKTCAALVKDDTLVEDSEKLYIVEFVFDKSWDGFTKTVTFKAGDVVVTAELTEDRYIIPSKCLERPGAYLRIGVSGEKDGEVKPMVWCLGSRILYKTRLDQITPSTSGDVTAQILAVIQANTATDEEVESAINDAFGSSSGSPGEESPGNTASDQEVQDLLNDVFGEEP